jgi:hypothetical protein
MHTRACTATHTHTCAHTHMYLVVHVWCARRSPHNTTRVGASAGPCERGGRGAHTVSRFGHSTAAGSAASSELRASLRANRAAVLGGSGPPRPRAGRQRCETCSSGAWPRPTTGNAAAAASNAVWCSPAPRRGSANAATRAPGTAANAQGGGGGRRGRTGSPRACTGRATRGAPSPSWRRWTCRGRARVRPAPAAKQWTNAGANGPKPQESHHACSHAHAHDRHTGAFGAAIVR